MNEEVTFRSREEASMWRDEYQAVTRIGACTKDAVDAADACIRAFQKRDPNMKHQEAVR